MEYSSSLSESLGRFSLGYTSASGGGLVAEQGAFLGFLEFTKPENATEINTIYASRNFPAVENLIRDGHQAKSLIRLSCPGNRTYREISGGEAILKQLCRGGDFHFLNKVTTPTGQTYYGCSGLILDSTLEPIMMSYHTFKQEITPTGFALWKDSTKGKILINKKIFVDQNDPLFKVIIKKVISYYMEHPTVTSWRIMDSVKMEVEFVDKMPFMKKISPKTSLDGINVELAENLDLVLSQIC